MLYKKRLNPFPTIYKKVEKFVTVTFHILYILYEKGLGVYYISIYINKITIR